MVMMEVHDVVALAESVLDLDAGVLTPARLEALRRQLPDAWRKRSSLVADLVLGTRKARDLGKARDGFVYTVVMAEQATHPDISEWHAEPYRGCTCVVEACTGAGVDAVALAAVAKNVVTFEANAVHAMIGQANVERVGCSNVTVVSRGVPSADWAQAVARADGLWADPSRRTKGGRRTRRGAEYDPPLDVLLDGLSHSAIVGVKVGPADLVGNTMETTMDSTWVGFRAEARERTLWRNAETRRGNRIYLADAKVEWCAPAQPSQPAVRTAVAGDVIVEPHNAIIASGYVGSWFDQHGMAVIDPRIGYGLAGQSLGASPWYQRWVVLDVEAGVDRKRIQQAVDALGWGASTVVKKRGVDVDPMELHRQLRFAESGPAGAIILVRTESGRCTIYAQRPA
jgi:hypothetical protein